jgi:DNA invertase Pin-like site-specific DNA recombinase
MITRSDVFNQIKKLNKGSLPAQHYILFDEIVAQMSMCREPLMELLEDLEELGVITINKIRILSVTLTGYGLTQTEVSAG